MTKIEGVMLKRSKEPGAVKGEQYPMKKKTSGGVCLKGKHYLNIETALNQMQASQKSAAAWGEKTGKKTHELRSAALLP